MPPTPQAPLVVEPLGSVVVARFARPLILSGETARTVTDLLEERLGTGPTRLVINCANVQSLTSLMLGTLVAINRKLAAAGGALALCDLRPEVREILDVVGLSQIVRIYDTEQAALGSLGR